MPIDPIALSQAGGWAVAVATWLAIGIGLVRRWWAPFWVVEELRALLKIATDQGDRNSRALERLAAALARKGRSA